MNVKIPTRKIDDKSTVIAKDFRIFDAPIKREREFDYDDLEGVVDDLDNPYDETLPILVGTPIPMKPAIGLDLLGGKCSSCHIDNPLVLKIEMIHNGGRYLGLLTLERMVEKMIRKGQNPQEKFQIICQNCNLLKHKINKYRRSLGLPQITKVSPNQTI
jgi:hypothetical protein